MSILPHFPDINECVDPGDNPTCHEHANCTDTEGSYECTCNTGFSGDGFDCSGMNTSIYVLCYLKQLLSDSLHYRYQ